MNRMWVLGLIAVAAGAVAACDGSRSAADVAHDTASAEQAAADNAAKVQQKADARIASARSEGRDEQRDLAHAEATQKLADMQAEGDLKLALARCESLSGATQQSCRDQANADFDVAKAKANQLSASPDRKP